MATNLRADIGIVGGGILGLAHAYMALRKGLRVVLFERESLAIGASVRNFGLIWPIGQEPDKALARAIRSRQHWLEVTERAGIWLTRNGSLHLAYHDDELAVLDEFIELYGGVFGATMLTPNQVAMHSRHARTHRLRGGLLSEMECTVNAREAVRRIPLWLAEQFGLTLRFGQTVTGVDTGLIETQYEKWTVDHVVVCSGSDFATLFPSIYVEAQVRKCKLQMMKAIVPASGFVLGPTLCAGLTLRHYKAFAKCPSLSMLNQRYDVERPEMKKFGIHVLLGQNNHHELIIGDSHQYGDVVDPFDSEDINRLILGYLETFVDLPGLKVTERWHGVYPQLPSGTELIVAPADRVLVVNALGGAGMTLSFGLAEEVIESLTLSAVS